MITSTAAQVIAAVNGSPDGLGAHRGQQVPHQRRRRRRRAERRLPAQRPAEAPPTIKRGPQDQWILRIGNDKGKPQGQKVGVYLYCQEHGGEIATSGVCLETMSRLVKNYGTDAATTSYVDNLDIFILPFINADGGRTRSTTRRGAPTWRAGARTPRCTRRT